MMILLRQIGVFLLCTIMTLQLPAKTAPKHSHDARLELLKKIDFTKEKLTVGELFEKAKHYIPAKHLLEISGKLLPVWDKPLPKRKIHKGKIFINGEELSAIVEFSQDPKDFWLKINGKKIAPKDFASVEHLLAAIEKMIPVNAYSLKGLFVSEAHAFGWKAALIIGVALLAAVYLITSKGVKVNANVSGGTNHTVSGGTSHTVNTNHGFTYGKAAQ